MTLLTKDQKEQFWRDGVLVIEDAVSAGELAELRRVFADWVEESRGHEADYGETLDGRPRFDLQPGHNAEQPALRRVQSPGEVSDVYAGVMRNARTVDFCAELIGPAIRLHHGKVNSKLPCSGTQLDAVKNPVWRRRAGRVSRLPVGVSGRRCVDDTEPRLCPASGLCGGATPLPEDQPLHVVGEVGHADLGPRAGDNDGSEEEPHAILLLGKGVLDMGAHLRAGGVGTFVVRRQCLAGRPAEVDFRGQAGLSTPVLDLP